MFGDGNHVVFDLDGELPGRGQDECLGSDRGRHLQSVVGSLGVGVTVSVRVCVVCGVRTGMVMSSYESRGIAAAQRVRHSSNVYGMEVTPTPSPHQKYPITPNTLPSSAIAKEQLGYPKKYE